MLKITHSMPYILHNLHQNYYYSPYLYQHYYYYFWIRIDRRGYCYFYERNLECFSSQFRKISLLFLLLRLQKISKVLHYNSNYTLPHFPSEPEP